MRRPGGGGKGGRKERRHLLLEEWMAPGSSAGRVPAEWAVGRRARLRLEGCPVLAASAHCSPLNPATCRTSPPSECHSGGSVKQAVCLCWPGRCLQPREHGGRAAPLAWCAHPGGPQGVHRLLLQRLGLPVLPPARSGAGAGGEPLPALSLACSLLCRLLRQRSAPPSALLTPCHPCSHLPPSRLPTSRC